MKRQHVHLPDDLLARLERSAKRRGVSLSEEIRARLTGSFLRQREDGCEARAVMAELLKGKRR